jgi:hypothetical protein
VTVSGVVTTVSSFRSLINYFLQITKLYALLLSLCGHLHGRHLKPKTINFQKKLSLFGTERKVALYSAYLHGNKCDQRFFGNTLPCWCLTAEEFLGYLWLAESTSFLLLKKE